MDGEERELPRAFGFWSGAALVAASMIGTGILVTPGYAAVGLGSHISAIVLWLLGGLLAFCGALTLAEMATAMPKVGGEYVYVERAWGPTTAFMYGWATLIVGFAGPTAAAGISAAKFLFAGLPENLGKTLADPSASWVQIVASALVLVFTFAHCFGQRSSAWVQGATTLFKYATLGAFALIGIGYGIRSHSWGRMWELCREGGAPNVPSAALWEHLKALAFMPAAAATALVYMSYTYVGWNGAAYVAGEIRDPARLLPRSLLGGCLAVTALYVAIATAFASTHSASELRALNAAAAATPNADGSGETKKENPLDTLALASLEKAIPHPLTRPVFSWIIGLGLVATISAFLLTGSRVMVAMARSGHFLSFAGTWNERRNAPIVALVLLGAPSAAMVWYGDLDRLLNFLGTGLTALGVVFGLSIFLLRRQPDYRPPFRLPLYPLPTILYLASCLFMLGMGFVSDWNQTAGAVGVVVAGAPVYWLIRGWRPSDRP